MAIAIQFPTTAVPVSMIGSDDKYSIVGCFGPIISGAYARAADPTLLEYVKGGEFVPNIASNSGVPTTAPIDEQDLLGAYAHLDIETMPAILVVVNTDGTPFKVYTASYTHIFKPSPGGSVFGTDHSYKQASYKWTTSGLYLHQRRRRQWCR